MKKPVYGTSRKDGREYPDPTPVAIPVGLSAPATLTEQIRSMIRSEKLKAEAHNAGFETFEEAEDFEIEDDDNLPDFESPWENDFDPTIQEMEEAIAEEKSKTPPADIASSKPETAEVEKNVSHESEKTLDDVPADMT